MTSVHWTLEAIAAVREEAWPAPGGVDEMHEALMSLACITEAEASANAPWLDWLNTLADSGRACRISHSLWLARERRTCLRAIYPQAVLMPALEALPGFDEHWKWTTRCLK